MKSGYFFKSLLFAALLFVTTFDASAITTYYYVGGNTTVNNFTGAFWATSLGGTAGTPTLAGNTFIVDGSNVGGGVTGTTVNLNLSAAGSVGQFTLQNGTSLTVNLTGSTSNQTLTITNGLSIATSCSLVLSTFGNISLTTAGSSANSGTLNISGSQTFTVTSPATLTHNTNSTLIYSGSTAKTTGGEFSSPYNVTVNNSAGVTLGKSGTINSALTLTTGTLTIGSNVLTYAGSNVTTAGGHIYAVTSGNTITDATGASSTWNAGAGITQTCTSVGCFVQAQVAATAQYLMFGLSTSAFNNTQNPSYSQGAFLLYADQGTVQVYESNSNVYNSSTTYATSDYLSVYINTSTGKVEYWKNRGLSGAVLVYTSAKAAPSFPLYPMFSMATTGAVANNIYVGVNVGGNIVQEPANFNSSLLQNVTVGSPTALTFTNSGSLSLPNSLFSTNSIYTVNASNTGSLTFGTGALSIVNFTENGSGGVTLGDVTSVGGPVTLNSAESLTGFLTLTSGVVTTGSSSILNITNTATSAISGGSSSSYISGPMTWTLLPSISADGTSYIYPLADASYRPFGLVNVRTGATSPVMKVTIAQTGATTGDGSTINTIVNPTNWRVDVVSGNFTSSTIQLTDTNPLSNDLVGEATAAQTGPYSSVGNTSEGASTINSGSGVTNSGTDYFALGNFTFSCTPPTSQSTIGTYTSNTAGGVTVNWTRPNSGGGDHVIVVGKLKSTAGANPINGKTYTASATFGSTGAGLDSTGTGNYVLYEGTGTSITVTGLGANTAYTFMVYEYFASGPCYYTSADSSSNTTYCAYTETSAPAVCVGNTTTITPAAVYQGPASGGNSVVQSGNYWIHSFTTTGSTQTFTTSYNITNAEVLIVGGGGSGGGETGGGGGGGGLIHLASLGITANTYTVTVGTGGTGSADGVSGSAGSNSIFITDTAKGGGYGATNGVAGGAGGSGGGTGANTTAAGGAATGTQGFSVQGNAGGGAATSGNYGAGGGGGADTVGTTGTTSVGGNGGKGLSYNISGSTAYYAGGGGGGADGGTNSYGSGGLGGGGNGGTANSNPAYNGSAGTINTGGGGGGGSYNSGSSGAGGSGIVIIKYIPAVATGGTWSSTNTSIATVNSSTGLITGVAAGTDTISYSITVNGCVNVQQWTITVNSTIPGAPTVTPANNGCTSTLTASNYTGALTWNTGATTSSITVSTVGTFSVTQTINACPSLAGTATASPTVPTTQSTIGAFTLTTASGATVNWTRGNGNDVIVVGRLSATAGVNPSSGANYSVASSFGNLTSGLDSTGAGNYVLYNGAGTSVTVTGLAASAAYTFTVYEYTSANVCYLTPGSSLADTTVCSYSQASSSSLCAGATTTLTVPTFTAPSGGTLTTSGGYNYHVFSSNGTFTVPVVLTAEVLIVGGGGGGASGTGGGGGAGGLIHNSSFAIAANTYTVKVGAFGAGETGTGFTGNGSNGGNSSFDLDTAYGGGGGGANSTVGLSGGSGGGEGWTAGGSAASGTEGYAGGTTSGSGASAYGASGGGGAGGVGSNGTTLVGGNGGPGVQFTQFAIVAGSPAGWFASGGGGGAYNAGTNYGTGGNGGGGNAGSSSTSYAGAAGTANTGGGGGGSSDNSGPGGNGGSGIVIIRYALQSSGVWASSNTSVATVNQSGLVTAVSAGTATITYKDTVGGCITVQGTPITVNTVPGVQAHGGNATNLTTTSATLNWTRGNGNDVMVIVRTSANSDVYPTAGTSYAVNTTFGTTNAGLDSTGAGNYVVYEGTGAGVTIYGLTAGTGYTCDMFEYNTTGGCILTPDSEFSFTTPSSAGCTPPSAQSTMTGFTGTTSSGTTVNWTRPNSGGGDNVIVTARLTSTTGVDPASGTNYNASSAFGSLTSGLDSTSAGNYVVYIGTGTSVAVTGLSGTSNYTFSVYEYFNTGLCYEVPGNAMNFLFANDVLSDDGTQVGASNVATGTSNVILLQAALAVTNAPDTITGLSCTTSGSYATADVTDLKVYYSTSATFNSGTATLLSTLSSPGGAGSQTFPSFTAKGIAAGSTGYIFITADIANGATGSHTISVNALSNSGNFTLSPIPGSFTGSTSTGGTITIEVPSITISDNGTQVAAATVAGGITNWVLHKSALNISVINATLSGMTCTTGETYASSDILNLKVYYSTSSIFSVGGSTLLSTLSNPGIAGAKTFTSFTSQLIPTGNAYIYITVDIAGGATVGNTINLSALTTGNYTFNGGTVSGTTSAGGAQTFSASLYYNKSSGASALQTLSNWGVNTDGSGAAPSSFTANNQQFYITNGSSATIGAAWTVSGTNSFVQIGDNADTMTFTIPSSYAFSSTATNVMLHADVYNQNASVTSLGTCTVNGTYQHAVNGGGIPTCTWGSSATCLITGVSTTVPSNLNQGGNLSYQNFTWNSPGGSTSLFLNNALNNATIYGNLQFISNYYLYLTSTTNSTLTVMGNLNVGSSNGAYLVLAQTSGIVTLNLYGNLTLTATAALINTGSSNGKINFDGNTTHIINANYSSVTFNNQYNPIDINVNQGTLQVNATMYADSINVASGATINFGTNQLWYNMTHTGVYMSSGSTFATANTGGISGDGYTSGTLVTTANSNSVFAAGVNYIFNGATATAFPAVIQNPTFGNPNNLTVNAGITLNRSVTVTGTITINSGATLAVGANTLTYSGNSITNSGNGIINASPGNSVFMLHYNYPNTFGSWQGGTGTSPGVDTSLTGGCYVLGSFQNTNPAMFGLMHTRFDSTQGSTYSQIQYAIYGTGGSVAIYESGTAKTCSSCPTYTAADVFMVRINNSTGNVEYAKQTGGTGSFTVFQTSAVTPTLPLQPAFALCTGAIVNNLFAGVNVSGNIVKQPLSLAHYTPNNTVIGSTTNLTFTNSASLTLPNSIFSTYPVYNFNASNTGSLTLGTGADSIVNLNMNGSGGLTLGSATYVSNSLTLTNGIIQSTSSDILNLTDSATTSITGGSGTSCVQGPMTWKLLSNISADGTNYIYPLMDAGNNYRPFYLDSVMTGATGPVIKVTPYSSGATTYDGSLQALDPENWRVDLVSGNFNSATIGLTEASVSSSRVAQSTAQSGTYTAIGNTSYGSIITSQAGVTIGSTTYFGFGSGLSSAIALSDNTPQVAAANIGTGATNVVLHQSVLTVSNISSTLTGMTCTAGGTYAPSDITDLKVYYSTSATFNAGSATLLSTLSGPATAGNTLTFQSFASQLISTTARGYIYITADIAAGAANGHTIDIVAPAPSNFTFSSGAITGSTTNGGVQTILLPQIAISDNSPQVTTGNLGGCSTNGVLLQASLAVSVFNASLTGMTCTTAGTYITADITDLKAWYSSSSTFNAGSATLLSTITSPGSAGTQTFTSFTSQSITAGTTGYIYITADISSGYTAGHTISVNGLSSSNFTFAKGIVSGSTGNGGAQTLTTAAGPTVVDVDNCGSSTLTASNYSGTLLWTPGSATSSSITVSTGGTYSVTATSGGCTTSPGTATAAPSSIPGSQATISAFTNTTTSITTVNWSRGGGDSVMVVGRLTATGNATPASSTSYNYNAAFGNLSSGLDSTGAGNYVLYKGTGTSVAVTGLTTNTAYTFSVYEYNHTGPCYLTPGSSLADTTICTYTTASSNQVSTGGTATLSPPAFQPDSGGTITTSGGYYTHIFTSNGTFKAYNSTTAEVLVVAGGGGGGGGTGGGGGAGALVHNTSFAIAANIYSVTVGGGGSGGSGESVYGSNGSNSVFSSITATGGNGGSSNNGLNPTVSGSGGGGFTTSGQSACTSCSGSVNAGGASVGSFGCGGGGGAGHAGYSGTGNSGGNGGDGLQFSQFDGLISGDASGWFAAGGGGGWYYGPTSGTGGSGIGGSAGAISTYTGGAGLANTGSGGGGALENDGSGGAGGSGVVIIKYPYPVGTWSSTNNAIATVNSSSGVVTGVSAGTDTINYSYTLGSCNYIYAIPLTVTGVPQVSVSDNGTQVASSSVTGCSGNVLLLQAQLGVTVGNTSLTGMNITTAGNYATTDIADLKVWYSSLSTFNAASDTLLSTLSNPGAAGSQTFTSFTSENNNPRTTGYIYITADIGSGYTVGHSISVNALSSSNFTFNTASVSGNTSAGGAQTISTAPMITGVTGATICTPGTVNLSATASGGTINWYAASTGGTSLATGTSYSPTITSTSTFYVDAETGSLISGCIPRTPVTGTVVASYGTGSIASNASPFNSSGGTNITVSGNNVTVTGNVSMSAGTYNFNNFTVNSGAVVTVTTVNGAYPLVINCLGTATVNGTININGQTGSAGTAADGPFVQSTVSGGAGGFGDGDGASGGVGGSANYVSSSSTTSGGSGASYGSLSGAGSGGAHRTWGNGGAGAGGGGGSYGTTGSAGGGTGGGSAGSTYGDAYLNTLYIGNNLLGGSGGGGGGSIVGDVDVVSGGGGGGGGGGIQISADTVNLTNGLINASGGNGGAGNGGCGGGCPADETPEGASGGGGGGSGGTVLIQYINLCTNCGTAPNTPGSTVNISGGSGGAGGVYNVTGGAGGAGGSGRFLLEQYLPGIVLGTSPSVCSGTTTTHLPYTATTGSPNQYSITWNSTALSAGFANVSAVTLTSSPISITVPASAAPATYNGTISLGQSGCNGASTTFTVTINPAPTVNITGSSSICGLGNTTTLSPASGGTWISNSTGVATVTNGGVVTAAGAGSATFTFTSSTAPNCSATTSSVTVGVTPTVNITGSASICTAGTTTLSPSTGGIWASNNSVVATVTNGGVVTGVTAGNATFTFTSSTAPNCTATTSSVTITNCGFNYTVKFFLQGYYLGGNTMSPLLHLLGAASATAVDTVYIQLWSNYSTMAYSDTGILQSNGNVTVTFPAVASGNSYYVVVKHRNSIDTWSANAAVISAANSPYDFTGSAGQAHGNNLVNLGGGVYGIYSGDINRDGTINSSDKSALQSVLSSFNIGVYNVNDITGDGFVDEDDLRILQNNIPLGITVSHP